MLRAKQRFVCEKCEKVFYEYMPDCIGADTAMLLLHPQCRKCRKKTPLGKVLQSLGIVFV